MFHMVKETGQKVTTFYKKTGTPVATQQNVSTSYVPQSGASKSEKLEAHASRRESNRAIRDSVSPAPHRGTPEDYDDAPTFAKGEKRPKASTRTSPLTPPPATGTPPAARPQKKQPPGSGGLPFAGVGQAFTELQSRLGPPDWISGTGWVLSGKMPWDASSKPASQEVTRTVITKIHADGTRTRSVRGGSATPRKGSNRPNWIRW